MTSYVRPRREGGALERFPRPAPPQRRQAFIGHALTASDIERFGSQIKGFLGVLPIGEIAGYIARRPKLPPEAAFVLFVPAVGGTPGHFVALVLDALSFREVDFFDSFGRTPKELGIEGEVRALIDYWLQAVKPPHRLKFKINRVVHQKAGEASCGTNSLSFIIARLVNRMTFAEATEFGAGKARAIQEADGRIVRFRRFGLV